MELPSQWTGGQGQVSWDQGRGRGEVSGRQQLRGRPAGDIIKPATGCLNYTEKEYVCFKTNTLPLLDGSQLCTILSNVMSEVMKYTL